MQNGVNVNAAPIKNPGVAENRPGRAHRGEKINKQETIQGRKL